MSGIGDCDSKCNAEILTTDMDYEDYKKERFKYYNDHRVPGKGWSEKECGYWHDEFNRIMYEKYLLPLDCCDKNCFWFQYFEEQRNHQYDGPATQKLRMENMMRNQPHCPNCNSVNIRKISTLDRATSVAFWGLASSKIGKTMQCDQCGYKW